MNGLKFLHRTVAVIIALFALNLCVTGTMMQSIDVHSYFTHAPGTDPNMNSLRESFNGPPNYEVLGAGDYGAGDYEAKPLPAGSDFAAMLARSLPVVRAAAAGHAVRFIEFRMIDGKLQLVADIKHSPGYSTTNRVRIDAATGALIEHKIIDSRSQAMWAPVPSIRNKIKDIHNLNFLGYWSAYINVIVGIAICTLIITGTWMYLKLLCDRRQLGKFSLFWIGGNWWRGLHRGVAIVAAAFLLIIAASGTWISYEGLYNRLYSKYYQATHHGQWVWEMGIDASSPLRDSELPAMLATTLAAQHLAAPNADIKVIRLRYYSGMPQGVVISGNGRDTQQLVFNTNTGKSVSETEPGYPNSAMPLGWQVHQLVKQIHRGDWLALPGQTVPGHLVDLLAGLSLFYLTISGLVMYAQMWIKRKRAGRHGIFWN